MKLYFFILINTLALNLFGSCSIQLHAQSYCDPYLPQDKNNPLSYHDRGDRCEGLYIQQLGSTTLRVVSFTESFEEYNLSSGKPILLHWDKFPGNNIVRLRSQSIKSKFYYRMDASCPPNITSFKWSSGVLSSLNILKKDIGIVGITKDSIRGKLQDVYLPLRISQQKEALQNNSYKLVLLPGVELSEIYLSISQLDKDGKLKKFIKDGEKLGYGFYPAERSVEIPITHLKEKGIYYLEIGATLHNGGSNTINIWFYNPKELN